MYTPIMLDKMRNFRYSMRALSLIEKSFKKPLARIEFGALTIEETMTVVWAGLVHEDNNLTPDVLLDIMDQHGVKFDDLVDAMTTAINEAFGPSGDSENPTTATAE